MEYTYYLKHRTTGEVIELGPSAELKPAVAKQHDIDPHNWSDEWIFGCQTVKSAAQEAVEA